MNRPFALILLLFGSTLVAQDPGLAGDFDRLSAKERTRIAREEEERAAADVAYQAVMSEAENLFREKRYDESLEKYKEARTLRPYNVYPRVKIQDLQALIAKIEQEERDSLKAREEPELEVREEPVLRIREEPVPEEREEAIAVPPTREPRIERTVEELVPPPTPREAPVSPPPVVQPKLEKVAPPMERPRSTMANDEPEDEGEYERILREGRALVVERRVYREGRPVIFRKVQHPWGEVVHFRDGIAIPARTWQEEFDER